jgi:hypothetical protein
VYVRVSFCVCVCMYVYICVYVYVCVCVLHSYPRGAGRLVLRAVRTARVRPIVHPVIVRNYNCM